MIVLADPIWSATASCMILAFRHTVGDSCYLRIGSQSRWPCNFGRKSSHNPPAVVHSEDESSVKGPFHLTVARNRHISRA